MSDRIFFCLAGAAAFLVVSLALAWPQGLGARSPAPFGHPLGRVEGEASPKKTLRKRLPADVAPNALTAPIPASRVGVETSPMGRRQ